MQLYSNPDRQELTVHLTSSDGEMFQCCYFRPDTGELEKLRPLPVDSSKLGLDLEYGSKTGLRAAEALLDHGHPSEIAERVRSRFGQRLGEVLFSLLFPNDRFLADLLRGMFPQQTHGNITPVEKAVRLRIWTDEPLLLQQPWRLVRWHGQLLINSGWTFELVQTACSEGQMEIFSPTKLLFVAPTYGGRAGEGDIGTDAHEENLKEILRSLSRKGQPDEGYFQRARTRSDLLSLLKGMQPEILYFYGHGDFLDDQLCLILDGDTADAGEQALQVSELLGLFGTQKPRIVFLNGCVTGAGGWQSAGTQLGAHIPLVIANRTIVFSKEAAQTAQWWFRSLFQDRVDPVESLHAMDEAQSQWQPHWMTTVIHRRYQYSRIVGPSPEYRDPDQHLDLDRDLPRAVAVRHVQELVSDMNEAKQFRKVEAIVAYATRSNLVSDFSTQLLRELTAPAHQKNFRVQHLPIHRFPQLPEHRFSELRRELVSELKVQLRARPTETLRQLLNRQHKAPMGTIPRVLWLDFGVFGQGANMHPPPTPLTEWLAFCKEVLAPECPDGLFLLATLFVEVEDPEVLPFLHEEIETAKLNLLSSIFRCSELPPLQLVTESDLLQYLTKAKHGPETLARELAKYIYQLTKGEYEAAVGLIRRGHREGWISMFQELKAKLPAPQTTPQRRRF